MGRVLQSPAPRQLNHAELFYAPGERALARELFRALGCRVLDPQEERGPSDLGPAAGPYLIVFVDPASADLIDNVLYASEVAPEQWAFEQELRSRLGADRSLRERFNAYQQNFERYPQGMTHLGLAMAAAQLEAAVARLASEAAFAGRLRLRGPYRPGEPGSVDARVIQAFVHTDILSSGLLVAGQQLELQARVG
jgi:hypothetical protein